MILQVANPGALIFFAALLTQFVDAAGSEAHQIAILALTSVCIEFGVLVGYGALAGRRMHLAQPRFTSLTNWVAGTMLIVAALRMVFFAND